MRSPAAATATEWKGFPMRAVVMRNFELVVDDVPQPQPAEGEALVKTLACGICGSDLHFLKFGQEMIAASRAEGSGRFAPDIGRDIVMGHEFCCEVVAYGPNTPETVPVGERCVSVPSRGAYSNDYPGGYSEYMVLDASMLLPVADSLGTHHAATTEPMAVGLHAVRAGAFVDEPAVIYGCGPVGLATIAALKIDGVGPIVAADFSSRRRELAGIMGADSVVDPRELSPVTALERLGSFTETVMFDAVGVPGMIARLTREAPDRGTRIVVVGVCMQQDTIQPMAAIEKELSYKFVLGYTPDEFEESLHALEDGLIDAGPLVTGAVGLDDVAGAFETLADPEEHCKIMVTPHERQAL